VREWIRSWHRYRRQNRFLVTTFVTLLVLSTGAVYLLQRTQAASPRELTNRLLLFVLWYLDLSLILVLLFILLRSFIRLAIERRSGVLGSRFRTKLVLTYVGLTFLPVILIFLVATNFLQRSIDRWFSAPVEEVLRGGAHVTEQLRELVVTRLERQALLAANELSTDPSGRHLERLHTLLGVDYIGLYRGPRLIEAMADARRIPTTLPPLPTSELLAGGRRADRWRGGLLVRAWAPVDDAGTVVVIGDMLPRELLLHLETASAAYATFQEMKLERGTVTSTTVLVFLALTLLLLFATVWVGLFLSRRFTEPLLAVAAATQRVAEGDRLEEVAVPATDEVAVLVHSFNEMVRRVRSTEAEIRASNSELETLLATIPTGVLTISDDGKQYRPNPAAARLLGDTEAAGSWLDAEGLHRPGVEGLAHLVDAGPSSAPAEVDIEIEGIVRHIEVTVRELGSSGRVVAIDDLTPLVNAQRRAAWSEVARRIAHEIKNPLTPIRLAAERIQRRTTQVDGEVRAIVHDGCEAIVAHVRGLKDLVDAFHEYARMPGVNPSVVSVSQLLREVLSLYADLRPGLAVTLELPAGDLHARLDPALMRQALVNLLDNAVESIVGPGQIVLAARVADQDLTLEIADTGTGLPTEDIQLLLQPFYSTKGRGSGMGLALVHRIVTEHGGHLELIGSPEVGATARMIFPGAVIQAPHDQPHEHDSPIPT